MKYKTCVTIAEKTPKRLKVVTKKALKKSDYVELRFDFLTEEEISQAVFLKPLAKLLIHALYSIFFDASLAVSLLNMIAASA